jgi:hemolysin D
MKQVMKSVRHIPESTAHRERRHAEELAFLPAALEIVETPPSPVGRAIALLIVALLVAGAVWSAVGSVDIVAVAPGRIVPSGRTKVVQPFETGIVRAIHIRDGQPVKTGEILIELDPTVSQAELQHLRADLLTARLDTARLRAALARQNGGTADFVAPDGASAEMTEMYRHYLISQTEEQNRKIATILRQKAQKLAERDTIEATINKLEATIPLLQERVDVRKVLYQKELGSKLLYLTELQDLVGQQKDLGVQKSRYQEAEAAVAALEETRAKTVAEYQRSLFEELSKAEQKIADLTQDVVKAEQKARLQSLTAPVDGTVQQLSVHTVGGVVTPAQALMAVVPTDSTIEIEAMVSNRDIGFIHAGQDAAIKIDTFNFTRYGLLHGKVLSISQDAITREKAQEKATDKNTGNATSSSEPKGQELVYSARVSFDRTRMQIDDRMVNLSPGMAVSVEIKTGKRSILSYLLSPIGRYRQETLRER